MTEKLKLAFSLLLLAAGLVAFYVLSDQALVLRLLALMGGLAAALVLVWKTVPGQTAVEFARESFAEARRVVWPTRKETLQTTAAVFALVVVMALFLWMVDAALMWGVKVLMGRSA